jgi:hypothetical protein
LFNKLILKKILQAAAFLWALLWVTTASANDRAVYQHWTVDIGSETVEAYTANESNSSLGLFCGGSTCVFYLNPNLNCQPNTKNAVLMNSATQSAAIGMQCTLVGKHYFQILDSFDQVFNAVKSGGNIGFAVALQGGAFSVYRFSLIGALPSLQRALEEASKRRQNKSLQPSSPMQPGFKDIAL